MIVANQASINLMNQPANLLSQIQTTVIVSSVDNSLPRSDRAALDWGLRTANDTVTICCPSDDQVAMRYACAAGAGRLMSPHNISGGLVVGGLGGGKFSNDFFLAQIAVKHQAELILEVVSVHWNDGMFEVIRDLGRGVQEKLRIPAPLVVGISAQATIAKYVSSHRRASAQLPHPPHFHQEVGPDAAIIDEKIVWQPIRKRPKTEHIAAKKAGNAQSRMDEAFGLSSLSTNSAAASGGNRVIASPQECANHLIRYLANFGFLDLHQNVGDWASIDHCLISEGPPAAISDPIPDRPGVKSWTQEKGKQAAVDDWSTRTQAAEFKRFFPQPIRPTDGPSDGPSDGRADGRADEELMNRLARRPRPYIKAIDFKRSRRPRPFGRENGPQLSRSPRLLNQ